MSHYLQFLGVFILIGNLTWGSNPSHAGAFKPAGFERGANLGNYLEVPPGQTWTVDYTLADLDHIQAEGFDHIRIPIGWHHYTSDAPGYKLQDSIFVKVDSLVDHALKIGLKVLINIHHFDDFTSDPEKEMPRLLAIWRQIAVHFKGYPEGLAFEIINEPKDKATTEVMNGVYPRVLKVIRGIHPERLVFIGPGRWNNINELDSFQLPKGDGHLVVTVHCYEPFLFTHQGASWTGDQTRTRGIRFPGPPESPLDPALDPQVPNWVKDWVHRYNTLPTENNPSSPGAFQPLLEKAAEWGKKNGVPVHVGEFGAYTDADSESRTRFYQTFRTTAEEHDLGWCMWDWGAGFRYWNRSQGRPEPGMREALFGISGG